MRCSNQKEQELLLTCKQYLSKEALHDVFIFTYDHMRRYEGTWHLERQSMFPGYVFLESKDVEQLTQEMERIAYMKRVLADNGPLVPLEQEEELFLRRFYRDGHHFGMSRGYIQDNKTFVTEGPLQGQEKLIRKIDRHKRIAKVGVPEKLSRKDIGSIDKSRESGWPGFSVIRELQVGLEIVKKS